MAFGERSLLEGGEPLLVVVVYSYDITNSVWF
jgi:hypothetical protein